MRTARAPSALGTTPRAEAEASGGESGGVSDSCTVLAAVASWRVRETGDEGAERLALDAMLAKLADRALLTLLILRVLALDERNGRVVLSPGLGGRLMVVMAEREETKRTGLATAAVTLRLGASVAGRDSVGTAVEEAERPPRAAARAREAGSVGIGESGIGALTRGG